MYLLQILYTKVNIIFHFFQLHPENLRMNSTECFNLINFFRGYEQEF